MLSHLHVVQSVEPLQGAGLGATARELHLALQSLGYGSSFLTTREAGVPDVAGVEQFDRRGYPRAFFAPGFARRLDALARDSATILHEHGFYVYPSWVVGRAARQHGRLLVLHPQGMLDPWILRRSRWKKRLAHWLFEDANFAAARLWRAVSAKEADQIRAQGIGAKIVVLPNGIDIGAFRPRGDPRPVGPRRLAFLGRIHPKKGLDLLLAAWARTRAGQRGWQLDIAGPDENGYARNVLQMIESSGLADSVRLIGVKTGSEKVDFLTGADAFVLTSYSEGMPSAVLEAMAAGAPAFVTDECNLPEIAAAGAGWICRPELAAVEATLAQVLGADDAELRQRGILARKLVCDRFQWPRLAEQLHAECAALVGTLPADG